MNERNDIERRLERHLHSIAEQQELDQARPGRARRRARVRTIRRRRTAVAGLAAASVVGAVAAVGVLSQPSASTIRSTDEGTGRDTTPSTSVGAVEAVPAPAVEVTDAASTSATIRTIAATAAEPAFVWKVIEPDKDAAIIGTFGEGVDTFPGLALSTAPGRSDDYDDIEHVLWRTDDGVTFERSDLAAPFGQSFWRPNVVGDSVFAVGTAPGVASTDPFEVRVAVTSLDGAAWETIVLPFESSPPADLPMSTRGTAVSEMTIGDSLFVAVTQRVGVDFEALARNSGIELQRLRYWSQTEDGVSVTDATCIEERESAGMPFATTTIVGVEPGLASGGECPVEEYSWDELGVPAETLDAVAAQRTEFFLVGTDGVATPVESPVPGALLTQFNGNDAPRFVVDTVDGRGLVGTDGLVSVFTFDGVSWSSSEEPLRQANFSSTPVDFGGRLSGMAFGPDDREVFAMLGDDGSVTQVDLEPLLGGDDESYTGGGSSRAAIADDTYVSVIERYPDYIARAGGVELTVDGITARQESDREQTKFFGADGERIPDEQLRHGSMGGVIVTDENGETIAEFTDEQLYGEMTQGVYDDLDDDGDAFAPRSSLITTTDGVSFSVESVADLLGLDEADVSRVQRIATDGTTIVVAVALNERHDDDSRRQLVLVGTPTG